MRWGLGAELGLLGADCSGVGVEKVGNAALSPELLWWGREFSVHSSCPKVGMLSLGEFAQTLHGTKKNLFFWKCCLKIV